MISILLASSLLATTAQPTHIQAKEIGLTPVGRGVPVQFVDGVVIPAPDLRGVELREMVRLQAARTKDGRVVRWSVQGDARTIEGLVGFEISADWRGPGDEPGATERAVAEQSRAPGLPGCRLLSSTLTQGRLLSAWRCKSADETVLGRASRDAQGRWGAVEEIAKIAYRFDLIGSEAALHDPGAPLALVRLDEAGRFHYARFYWIDPSDRPVR